jgi:hypothetical protein
MPEMIADLPNGSILPGAKFEVPDVSIHLEL